MLDLLNCFKSIFLFCRSSHPDLFCKEIGYEKIGKTHKKTPVLESLSFNDAAGLPIKRRIWDKCFPVNCADFPGCLFHRALYRISTMEHFCEN